MRTWAEILALARGDWIFGNPKKGEIVKKKKEEEKILKKK